VGLGAGKEVFWLQPHAVYHPDTNPSSRESGKGTLVVPIQDQFKSLTPKFGCVKLTTMQADHFFYGVFSRRPGMLKVVVASWQDVEVINDGQHLTLQIFCHALADCAFGWAKRGGQRGALK